MKQNNPKQEKKRTQELFKSRCFVCRRKAGKGFTFHHLYYSNGDRTYRDFKRTKDYEAYILQQVEKNPHQFLLLCHKHHFAVETLKRFNRATFERLVKAVRMSTQ